MKAIHLGLRKAAALPEQRTARLLARQAAELPRDAATASERPQDELVIRIHPAETSLPGKLTREPLGEFLDERHRSLPPNIRVAPDAGESSYDLMAWCDAGLVYTSTTGLELATIGKPVVVTGNTHYGGKGFTIDVDSPRAYEEAIDRVLADPVAARPGARLARRYAYYLPVPRRTHRSARGRRARAGVATLLIDDVSQLAQGHDAEFDLVCEGILNGGDFFRARASAGSA